MYAIYFTFETNHSDGCHHRGIQPRAYLRTMSRELWIFLKKHKRAYSRAFLACKPYKFNTVVKKKFLFLLDSNFFQYCLHITSSVCLGVLVLNTRILSYHVRLWYCCYRRTRLHYRRTPRCRGCLNIYVIPRKIEYLPPTPFPLNDLSEA